MQLFISDNYSIDKEYIIIYDDRIIHQCLKVLRMKTWWIFLLQDNTWYLRYTIAIDIIDQNKISGHIIEKISYHDNRRSHTICIALPNRVDKAELIVQKLSEIGIENIIFMISKRSIIHELSEKKVQRLYSIAIEAVEQSFGKRIPSIAVDKLENIIKHNSQRDYYHYLLDHQWTKINNTNNPSEKDIYTYIWPEWWFTQDEKEMILQQNNSQSISLWNTNLRMETAAIISARMIYNL